MSYCCFWWRVEAIVTTVGLVGWSLTILTLRRANRLLGEYQDREKTRILRHLN